VYEEAMVPELPEVVEASDEFSVAVNSVAISHVLAELDAHVIGVPATQNPLPEPFVGLPEIGNAHTIDFEALAYLEADLVVVDAGFREAHEAMLEELGQTAYFFDTSTFSGFVASIAALGELVNREEEASAITGRLENAMTSAKSELVGEMPAVAILFGAGDDLMLATPNSYVGNLVSELGMPNIATEFEGAMFAPFVPFSAEQLIAIDPELILRFAHASVTDATAMFDLMFDENPALQQLEAVQSGQMFDLDSRIFGVSANLRVEEAFSILGAIFNGEE